jgi:hypothetical protein
MKALQINTTVNTSTGFQIPAGAVVIINEFLTQQFNEKDGNIPCQINISTYINKDSYESGKSPVQTVSDYSNLIISDVTEIEYQTVSCEELSILEVQDVLLPLYPNNVQLIEVTKPTL